MTPATFTSLQSLRGLFAFFIFLHHLGLFRAGGDSGVAFFIILSGFVMSAGYKKRILSRQISYKSYIAKRFRRIYPYHIIGFVLSILLMHPFYGKITPIVWLANLTMLQSWIPSELFFFSCDSPSWCLSDLFFCYAVFPFLTLFFSQERRWELTLPFLITAYFTTAVLLTQSLRTPLLYINPAFRAIDFIIGITLWRFFDSKKFGKIKNSLSGLSSLWKSAIEFAAVLLAIAFYVFYPFVPENFALASWWWIPVTSLILIFSSFQSGGVFSKLLNQSWAIKFGDLSFAFYMVHVPIISGYKKLAQALDFSPDISFIAAIIIFLSTLFVSILCERTIRRFLHTRGGG